MSTEDISSESCTNNMSFRIENVWSLQKSISKIVSSDDEDMNLYFEESPRGNQEDLTPDITQLTQQPISNSGVDEYVDINRETTIQVDANKNSDACIEESLLEEIGHCIQDIQENETSPMSDQSPDEFPAYACFRCDFETNSELTFRRHTLRHIQKDKDCTTCEEWLKCINILPMMEDWQKLNKERRYPCSECSFKGFNLHGVRIHASKVHRK